MDPKRWLMICTIAFMLTVSGGWRGGEASAASKDEPFGSLSPADYALTADRTDRQAANDPFLELLGAASEEDVRDALYNGESLSGIAAGNGLGEQALIDAQVDELTEQLRDRLLSGSITWEQYQAYKSEVPELIADSARSAAGITATL